jgi:methionyl-tRNA formyltransferase
MPDPAGTDQARGRVVFVGAVHEARPALAALLTAPVDLVAVVSLTPSAAARAAGFVDLAGMAKPRGIPVMETADLNAPEDVARVRAMRPDLVIVVGWNRLLGDELLAVPTRGAVGFHASLLPRHRGRAPVNWVIIRGENITGNTMMYLAPGADTGDIIDQRRLAIDLHDTCATVYEKVGESGAEMILKHLPALLRGTAPRLRQKHEDADLLPKRTPAMGITDWHRTPRQVHDWVRALTHPYPGAFTFLGGHRLHVWASALPGGDEPAWEPDPGTLMGLEGDAVRVRVASGSVLLIRVQQEHEAEEPAAAWFVRKGHRRGLVFAKVEPEIACWALGEGPRPVHVPWLDTDRGGEK